MIAVIQAGTIFKERLDALEGLLYAYIVLGERSSFARFSEILVGKENTK